MPAIAYAAVLFGGAVASLIGFAAFSVREFNSDAARETVRQRKLVLLLARRRGEFVSFFMNDGKSVAGRVAFVDVDELLVHIDIRKLKRDERGHLTQHDEPPQVANLAPVDMSQVHHLEHTTETYEDDDEDIDLDVPGYGEGDD